MLGDSGEYINVMMMPGKSGGYIDDMMMPGDFGGYIDVIIMLGKSEGYNNVMYGKYVYICCMCDGAYMITSVCDLKV